MIYEIRNTQYYFTFNGRNGTFVLGIGRCTCDTLLILVLAIFLV